MRDTYQIELDTSYFETADFLSCQPQKQATTIESGTLAIDCTGRKMQSTFAVGHMNSISDLGDIESKVVSLLEKNYLLPQGVSYVATCVDNVQLKNTDSRLRNCTIVKKASTSPTPRVVSTFSIYYFNMSKAVTHFIVVTPIVGTAPYEGLFKKQARTSMSFIEKAYAGGEGTEGGGSGSIGNVLGDMLASVGLGQPNVSGTNHSVSEAAFGAAVAGGMSITGPGTACCNDFGDSVSIGDFNSGSESDPVYTGSGSTGLTCPSGQVPITSSVEYSCYVPQHECCGPEGTTVPASFGPWTTIPPADCPPTWQGQYVVSRSIQSCVSDDIPGMCSPTHYSCAIGTSINNVSGATSWTWSCDGLNGGTSAACSENKPVTMTNPGVCGSGAGITSVSQPSGTAACESGSTFNEASDSGTAWNWQCSRDTTVSCSAPKPSATNDAPVTSFTFDNYNLSYGATTVARWSATNGATSCTASGDWTGAQAVSQSGLTTAPATFPSYTFTLACSNAYGTSAPVTRTLTVCPHTTPTWNGSFCVASTPGVCANGATDYPTCTPPATCQNGATDYPACTPATGACASQMVTWGSCSAMAPARSDSSWVTITNTAPGFSGTAGFSCNTETGGMSVYPISGQPMSPVCNPVEVPPTYTCNVPTDTMYTSTIVPCSGVCSNGSLVYPSCPQPTKPDLIGGTVSIVGHPTYSQGSTQVIDILSGETVTVNGTIRNQGLTSTPGSFNNYIELTTITYGALYMPGVYTYTRIGQAINTSALASGASRGISTTDTITLSPSIDLAAPGFPAPGSKMYYLRTCADRSSPTDTTGVVDEVFDNNNCQSNLTFLNVTSSPTGTLTSSAPTCSIATGESSCTTNLTWNTSNTSGTVEVTSNNPSASNPIFTGTSGGPSPVSVSGVGATIFYLYNNAIDLANTTVTTSCEGTGGWDTISSTCRDPQVVSAAITGKYYPPGTLTLTCSGSNAYSITRDGNSFVPVTPYTGPVTVNTVSLGGSYVMKCIYGSVSDQVVRPYEAVPGATLINLKITPTTIASKDDVVITWDTKFPTNACSLSASVVCANNACSAPQLSETSALNQILNSTTTDRNDPSTQRPLQTAIRTVAPGHKDKDVPIVLVDWKALGKKTLKIRYTTDFIYDCGGGNKATKRVQVTKSELQ